MKLTKEERQAMFGRCAAVLTAALKSVEAPAPGVLKTGEAYGAGVLDSTPVPGSGRGADADVRTDAEAEAGADAETDAASVAESDVPWAVSEVRWPRPCLWPFAFGP